MRFLAALFLCLASPALAEPGIASVYAVPGKDRYAGRVGACGEATGG
jgi:hypothetical protein